MIYYFIIPVMESANKTWMQSPSTLDSHQDPMVALFSKIKIWLLTQ